MWEKWRFKRRSEKGREHKNTHKTLHTCTVFAATSYSRFQPLGGMPQRKSESRPSSERSIIRIMVTDHVAGIEYSVENESEESRKKRGQGFGNPADRNKDYPHSLH